MKSILLLSFILAVGSAQYLATYTYPPQDTTCSVIPLSVAVEEVGSCYATNENPIWYRTYCDEDRQVLIEQTCTDSKCQQCSSVSYDSNQCNGTNIVGDYYTFNCSASPSDFANIPGTLVSVIYSGLDCNPNAQIQSVEVNYLGVCNLDTEGNSYYYMCEDVNHAYQYYCQSTNCTDCKVVNQNLVADSCYTPPDGDYSSHNFCKL